MKLTRWVTRRLLQRTSWVFSPPEAEAAALDDMIWGECDNYLATTCGFWILWELCVTVVRFAAAHIHHDKMTAFPLMYPTTIWKIWDNKPYIQSFRALSNVCYYIPQYQCLYCTWLNSVCGFPTWPWNCCCFHWMKVQLRNIYCYSATITTIHQAVIVFCGDLCDAIINKVI